MSTYGNTGYIYGELAAELDVSIPSRINKISQFSSWFEEAGWTIESVTRVVKIYSNASIPALGNCVLGSGQDIFFGVGLGGTFSYTVILDSSACFPTPVSTLNIMLETCTGSFLEYEIETLSRSTPGTPPVGLDFSSTALADFTAETWHKEVILPITAAVLDGINAIYLYTENTSGDDWVSYILIPGTTDTNIPHYGGQINASATDLGGAGFIATSQDNIVDGNKLEMYVYYDSDPAAGDVIKFATIPGSSLASLVCSHPLIVFDTYNGGESSIRPGLPVDDPIYGFVGPYWFCFDTDYGDVNITRASSVWGGAARIKPLEEETGEPQIKKVIILAGSVGVGFAKNPCTFKFSPLADVSRMYFWGKEGENTTLYKGTGIISLVSLVNTNTSTSVAYAWYDGTRDIFEPWIAWNWSDPSDSTAYAPIHSQIPDSIHIIKDLGVGFPDGLGVDGLFLWDRQLYRYYKTDITAISGATQPDMATAFVVETPQVFTGGSYSGYAFATIEDVEVDTDPIASSGSAIVTVTVESSLSSRIVFARTSNKRLSLDAVYKTLGSGDTSCTFTVTDNGLGTTEDVVIEVFGYTAASPSKATFTYKTVGVL